MAKQKTKNKKIRWCMVWPGGLVSVGWIRWVNSLCRPSLCRVVCTSFVLVPVVVASSGLVVWIVSWFRDLPAVAGMNPRCSLSDLHSGMCRQEHLEWTSPPFGVPVLPSQVLYQNPIARLEVTEGCGSWWWKGRFHLLRDLRKSTE